jgi:hypothetical protein
MDRRIEDFAWTFSKAAETTGAAMAGGALAVVLISSPSEFWAGRAIGLFTLGVFIASVGALSMRSMAPASGSESG